MSLRKWSCGSKNARLVFLIALLSIVGGLGARAGYKHFRWKRFATVVEGRIYRSGRLSERQMAAAIDRYGFRTIVCLDPEREEIDRRLCREKGIECRSFPMPSDGVGESEQFARILKLCDDPAHYPLLIHCRAGVARTGAAVALYRQIVQGWSFDAAIAELRSFERKGRCEPKLQRHIAQVRAEITGASDSRSTAIGSTDAPTLR